MGGCNSFHIIESQAQPFGLVNIAVRYPVKLIEDMIDVLMRYAHPVVCYTYLKVIVISDQSIPGLQDLCRSTLLRW